MKEQHLALLACPSCAHALTVESVDDRHEDRIRNGVLACTNCREQYPVSEFIPRFVPEANYAASFGLQWNRHRRTQFDSFSGLNLSRTRFLEATGWEPNLGGKLILEAGCGSGRFTEQAVSTGAMVVSFDYSNAVDANYANNGHHNNLLVVQASIFTMPFRPAMFDRVFCFGVVQHTPDPRGAFEALVPAVKPGGLICIDVYKKNRLGKFLSFTPAPPTKYYVRPFTTRMPPMQLYSAIERYIDRMWLLSRFIGRIPVIGRRLNWLLLVPDYRILGLNEAQARAWACLDAFDMLAPQYDQPQTLGTVRQWFAEADLCDAEVEYGYNGIVGRARRKISSG